MNFSLQAAVIKGERDRANEDAVGSRERLEAKSGSEKQVATFYLRLTEAELRD